MSIDKARARNIFPLLTASTTEGDMLRYLKNPEIAIGFALEHLEDWELRGFFKDWKADADMTPWLEAWRTDQKAALGDWSGHEVPAE
ncbi:hypothetical protein M8R20_06765 [Pseudomonas sp. R2.Fl]|nr:hypothetical protein [Pseudomonas sp. R2.Fl]